MKLSYFFVIPAQAAMTEHWAKSNLRSIEAVSAFAEKRKPNFSGK
jgi:hypothetical protein